MKAKEELKEFRSLSALEIAERIRSTRQEMMNLRFRKASGQLAQSAQVSVLRRRIARLNTVLSENMLTENMLSERSLSEISLGQSAVAASQETSG